MSSRNGKVQPLEIQGILRGQGTSPAKPSPVEHVASPTSPAPSTASSGRVSLQSHSKTMSTPSAATEMAPLATRHNRFSMSFPIQPSASNSPTRAAQSPVREATTPALESAHALAPAAPTDTNFLTEIAKQERRVLELKEELLRAEGDLDKLKKQWAQHEAQKKRSEAKKVTKLQPLQTSPSLPSSANQDEDSDGSSAWMQQEMERRKALMGGNRSSNRTVFSGSRHTRTLSLLSPGTREPTAATSMQPPPRPARKESLAGPARRSQDDEISQPRPKQVTRAATTSDISVDGANKTRSTPNESEEGLPENALDRDIFLRTGKKMATDFRDGLYTFWEDLRQATVGDDEIAQMQQPRRQGSNQTLRSTKKQRSQTTLRPSSRGSSTASKSASNTKRTSPARSKHTKSATMSLGSGPALADPSFWSDHGIVLDQHQMKPDPIKTASNTAASHVKSASKVSSATSSENETWDAWDDSSPHVSRSSSAASETATRPSTVSSSASPRQSTDVPTKPTEILQADRQSGKKSERVGGKDPIPWPALSNLGPKALRRTASHLMSEWEKSLTPSPTKEHQGQADYLGLGAEPAASSVSVERKKD